MPLNDQEFGAKLSSKPRHVTLEPNEENRQGMAATAYFPEGTSPEAVEAWFKSDPDIGLRLGLWVDINDPHFNIVRTRNQPFPDYTRYQAHPTG
jgi:hypothetical protein